MILPQLTSLVAQYLAVRAALGFTTRAARPLLHQFLAFLETQPSLESLPARVAFEWACGDVAPRAATSRAARLRVVRGFLTYAKASVRDLTCLNQDCWLASAAPPSSFTPEGVGRLLTAAAHLPSRSGWAAVLYPTLLGLLASCGLRTGEVLRLQLQDVNLEAAPPHLPIRQTKFRKSRIVPLHPTAVAPLREYLHLRQRMAKTRGTTTFFLSERGTPLGYDSVYERVQSSQCDPTDGSLGPRSCDGVRRSAPTAPLSVA